MKNQVLTLESTINFGEHSGKTMAQIIANHPSYLIWMIENIDYIAFDESVIMELNLPDYIININSQKIEGFYDNSWIDDDIIDNMDEINYSNWKEDTWYAMTDGIYGDMPEDFDGDFSFLGY